MLPILMYHRVFSPEDKSLYPKFKAHLKTIFKNYHTCFPGEKNIDKKSICLTFDDAYYDFYFYVFPLLKQYNLKAVLAVPTYFILDDTDTNIEHNKRLKLNMIDSMTGDNYKTHAPFCTWKELKEMTESGLVQIASHSHSHANLKLNTADLKKEIIESKDILEKKLGIKISTLIYPYGRFNPYSHKIAMDNYDYILRIGNAINLNWTPKNKLLYRIDADTYWAKNKSKLFKVNLFYIWNFCWNRLRGK